MDRQWPGSGAIAGITMKSVACGMRQSGNTGCISGMLNHMAYHVKTVLVVCGTNLFCIFADLLLLNEYSGRAAN